MKFPRFLFLCMALLSGLWLSTAQALPNVDEVQAAVKRGDYPGAEKMMREVVAAKPDSPRAHYVLAEILAHTRQFNEAAEHVRRARALDPAIKFADSTRFSTLEQLLQREQAGLAKSSATTPAVVDAPPPMRAAPVERSSGGGVPVWLLAVGAIVFIWLVARWMRNRVAAQSQPAMAGSYGAGGGYGQGYGPQGYGPGVPPTSGGPGLMGVGLAAAGGVAAGMLAEKLLHEGHDERSIPRDTNAGGSGYLPGSFGSGGDSGAADELTRRDIDFGSGDGWGGGSDAGGGDFGGGGDSGGGGGDW
ncbi:tetratricopeptide repeat protein [Roseateles sp. NT4]|uniref:tetratricopeptide repeat protein n=1 Tax=Roseateles sp. NT4 TaxID=3453715 RepID=UPI003EEFCD7A